MHMPPFRAQDSSAPQTRPGYGCALLGIRTSPACWNPAYGEMLVLVQSTPSCSHVSEPRRQGCAQVTWLAPLSGTRDGGTAVTGWGVICSQAKVAGRWRWLKMNSRLAREQTGIPPLHASWCKNSDNGRALQPIPSCLIKQ